jgi:hypothetical protein
MGMEEERRLMKEEEGGDVTGDGGMKGEETHTYTYYNYTCTHTLKGEETLSERTAASQGVGATCCWSDFLSISTF